MIVGIVHPKFKKNMTGLLHTAPVASCVSGGVCVSVAVFIVSLMVSMPTIGSHLKIGFVDFENVSRASTLGVKQKLCEILILGELFL